MNLTINNFSTTHNYIVVDKERNKKKENEAGDTINLVEKSGINSNQTDFNEKNLKLFFILSFLFCLGFAFGI